MRFWKAIPLVLAGLIGVAAQAQILRFGGASVLPPGVTLQEIDGGSNYFAANSFTYATSPITFNGVTYPLGWDDPKFFPIGVWQTDQSTSAAQSRLVTLRANVADGFFANGPGVIRELGKLGISCFAQTITGDFSQILANNGGIGSACVGLILPDEPPQYQYGVSATMGNFPATTFTGFIDDGSGGGSYSGIPGSLLTVTAVTNFSPNGHAVIGNIGGEYISTLSGAGVTAGTVVGVPNGVISSSDGTGQFAGVTPSQAVGPSVTMTQSAITTQVTDAISDNRPFWLQLTSNWISTGGLTGQPLPANSASTVLNTAINTPSGTGIWTTRYPNLQSVDIYWTSGTQAALILGIGGTIYSLGTPMTADQLRRNSHVGDMVDAIRYYQSPTAANPTDQRGVAGLHPAPIIQVVDNGGPYDGATNTTLASYTQPMEMNWGMWSAIIHGARNVLWFNASFGGPSGAPGTDNFSQAFYTTPQAALLVGSSTGSTLQVTQAINSGFISPGMKLTGTNVSTGAVTPTILAQLAGSIGGVGAYLIDVGNASGVINATQTTTVFNQAVTTDELITTLAPVINSPFAKNYITTLSPLGYNFPTMNLTVNNGIDAMAKYYTGGTYTTSGATLNNTNSITNGFYIFATTRNSEQNTNISGTFTLAGSASSITVINENRTVAVTGGNTFTDTFANAWTVHIYQVHP